MVNEDPDLIDRLEQVHQRLAENCIRAIVSGPIDAGGQCADVMSLLESINLGVLISVQAMGRDVDEDIGKLQARLTARMDRSGLKATVRGVVGRA